MIKTILDLTPAPYNPRVMTESAFVGLKTSIDEFGDLSGIVYNNKTGNLVSGHQRVNALKHSDASLVVQNDDRGQFIEYNGDRFYIRFVEWDIEKERLANVVANNPNIQGNWSDDIGMVLDDIMSTGVAELAPLQIPSLAHTIGIHGMPDPNEEDEDKNANKAKTKECPSCGHIF